MVLVVVLGTVMAAVEKEDDKKDAKKTVELKTEKQKVGYSIGTQIGGSFSRDGIDIDLDAFVSGFSHAYSGKELVISETEIRGILEAFSKRMQAVRQKQMEEQKKKMAELAPKNAEEGKKFLEANKKKKGVVELSSGLQYKVIKKGKGDSPKAIDTVKVRYRGTLIDGTEFDSSYKRGEEPVPLQVSRVIKGWIEALQLMKEGAKWELYIPSDLAYGPQGPPNIGPNATLIFEVELVSIEAAKQTLPPMPGKPNPPK